MTTLPPSPKKTGTTGREEYGAGNETRTRDPNLGKVVLYQLSYSRRFSLTPPCPGRPVF